jgi:hypothetical protein
LKSNKNEKKLIRKNPTVFKRQDNNKEIHNIESFGPFIIEQKGNIVKLSNILEKNEQEKIKREMVSKRPDMKEKIVKLINILKNYIDSYCALDFLDYMTMEASFLNPDTFQLFDKDLLEMHYEYALSYVTANCKELNDEHPTLLVCQQFRDLIKEIISLCIQYYMWEDLNSSTEKSIRFQSILSFLSLRGDSYEKHHIELCKTIFTPHNDFFKDHIGFTIKELIEMVNEIKKQRIDTFNKKGKLIEYRKEIIKIVEGFKKEKKVDFFDEFTPKLISELYNNEKISDLRDKQRKLLLTTSNYYSEITPNEYVKTDLLDFFNLQLGENEEFLKFTANWPLNNSKIYRKPILKVNNDYYGFGNLILFRNMIRILESVIKDYDEIYYNDNYMDKKSKILENLTKEYFFKLLPQAKFYQNLFYEANINGESKRVEVDLIILYDKHLFIIEAKANNYSLSARRGSLKRIRRTLKKVLDKAYEQAVRCKKYIDDNQKVNFEYENGTKVLSINKEEYDHFYLINTTMERFRHLSIQFNELKQLDFLKKGEQFWTVFINDLRIIAEVNDSPSVFLLFLQRRFMANKNIAIFNQDELEIYSYFLKTGLYFPKKISNKTKIQFFGQTDKIDKYYLNKSKFEKPTFNVSENYLEIVKKIEEIHKPGFTIASTFLLSIST